MSKESRYTCDNCARFLDGDWIKPVMDGIISDLDFCNQKCLDNYKE